MPEGHRVVRIYDEKLWIRMTAQAHKERVPMGELVRRAVWAYVADPSIAAELTRENPDASYVSKQVAARRYMHSLVIQQAHKNKAEKKAETLRKKKLSEQIEDTVREQHPVEPVPDPFGLGF